MRRERAEGLRRPQHLGLTRLCGLATSHPSNQAAIAAEGGIAPLIALLSGSQEVHRDAAGALWALAAGGTSTSAANQAAIAEAGGIAPLVHLLAGASKAAQDTAAGALCVLAALADNRAAIAKARGVARGTTP